VGGDRPADRRAPLEHGGVDRENDTYAARHRVEPPGRGDPSAALLVRGDVLGVLTLYGGLRPPPPRRTLLDLLVNLAAHALYQEVQARTLTQQQAELATFIDVGQDISASFDLDEVLRCIVRQATPAHARQSVLLDACG